ncbi:MAG: hypothetical protein SynsKO_19980 [Synoicihabitans sp.]
MTNPLSHRLDRRTALKWMGTAAASAVLRPHLAAAESTSALEPGMTIAEHWSGPGYGADPDLVKDYAPGDLWPLTFDEHQRRTAAVLCGLIIPADEHSPSAADLQVHDFIDEWISSPYPQQAGDRKVILDGLPRLDALSESRFGDKFADLSSAQHSEICNQLGIVKPDAAPDPSEEGKNIRALQRFFRVFRNLTAGGFYTTPEGMKDVGYIGNVVLAKQPQPPADLLKRLGVD